ncbi:hypothetical protein BBW65_03825 [Helicobacter enhydrae]|uniref:Outer membrane protein n=1 Tax=Helicobacter enhydrae TaxID=222136 RepID=A0A1B1U5E3_9HELI|nr:outer membrane beta-barrel protein [Helicobacter enhydrae]ANV97979.1 hypothetical protein BBW65_03825 [Helicobacter enhydrae]
MKKKLLSLILASCALVSVSQARFFVGIEGGYTATIADGTGLTANSMRLVLPAVDTVFKAFDHGVKGYSVGGVFGSENFWGDYLGTRWGIDVGYTSVYTKATNVVSEFLNVGWSSDVLVNFVNTGAFSLGIFGGASTDYHYDMRASERCANQKAIASHLLDFSWRAGVSAMLANHHRLEFLAKMYLGSLNIATDRAVLGGVRVPVHSSLMASYKFVF